MAPPRTLGIVEQRHFPLGRASGSDAVLFLDDVFVQPFVVERLLSVLQGYRARIAASSGLSQPGSLSPKPSGWTRSTVLEGPIRGDRGRGPKPAAVATPPCGEPPPRRGEARPPARRVTALQGGPYGSRVLYDRKKLLEAGGFSFQDRLPRCHTGEDVVVQKLPRRYGGCGIVPSGTYLAEVETTTFSPSGTVEADVLDLFSEIIER